MALMCVIWTPTVVYHTWTDWSRAQVTLLKAGTFEVMLVHLACLFDSKNNTMLFVNGSIFQRSSTSLVSDRQ